jgi:RNA recognition motif-containing protein
MDQKELSALFSPFGDIISCKLEVFNDGKSRNFGYV